MDFAMNTKLYVDNLLAATTHNELLQLFATYGNVMNVNIVVDRTSQKPRGFGFITMATPEGACAAIRALHGKTTSAGTLTVSEAWPDEDHAGWPRGPRSPRRCASRLF
jgi:RNA recognition motif-containing protein